MSSGVLIFQKCTGAAQISQVSVAAKIPAAAGHGLQGCLVYRSG